MYIYYSDTFVLPLPENHRFPMEKYARLRGRITAANLVPAEQMRVPDAATDAQLLLAHTPDYLHAVTSGTLERRAVRRIGFPWSNGLVERSRRSVGATISAARASLTDGISANLAGGTHHAFADKGGGFCVFNDAVVAIRTLQQQGHIQRALIIDCDVHQGDGTASITQDDDTIFTFSMHGENNYPFYKETSDLDIPLPDGTSDDDYLAALTDGLAECFARITPDLVIYLAGADPFEGDKLGRLSVSKSGLLQRDKLVFEACDGIPISITMAGGYARDVSDTVDIHFQTVELAVELNQTDQI